MKVILKPISHPPLGDIDIGDALFAIGRNEEPFASRLGEDMAASLSRRHARVFQENGKVFVADLGSRNGTRINERRLKQHVATALHNNDYITFGDALEFRVVMLRASDKPVSDTRPTRLTLIPEDAASGLGTLVLEGFPYLISRNEGEFEQYRQRLPEAWRRLSRRHAVIELKSGRINVEDLGSVNGTFVSGVKLGEGARPLADGDIVAFGDPVFSYKARIENLREPAQAVARAEVIEPAPYTEAPTALGSYR